MFIRKMALQIRALGFLMIATLNVQAADSDESSYGCSKYFYDFQFRDGPIVQHWENCPNEASYKY